MPDNFIGEFYFQVNAAMNNDLADSTQGVCGVRIHFDHEYLGDLTMRLYSPAGQSITLVEPVGFFGVTDFDDWNIWFVPCDSTAVPDSGFSAKWNNNQSWGTEFAYNGSYYPNDGCLEQFDTGSVSGTWRLEVSDNQPVDVGNLYAFEILFCDTTGIACVPVAQLPIAAFEANPTGWQALLDNHSSNAQTYQLEFGDGESYSGPILPGSHNYADTGLYQLRLIAINMFGTDTSEQSIYIAGSLPFASPVMADPGFGCAPLSVQFAALNADHVDTYHWLLPGATPAESMETAPQVVYNSSGVYPVTLIITNVLGADTIYLPAFIEVGPHLFNPGFTVQVQGDSIIATNTTLGYTAFYWLFNGEPVNSNAVQQIFTVDSTGTYLIGLFVGNSCSSELVEQLVPVTLSGLENLKMELFGLSLLPNPTNGRCRLEVTSPENLPARILVLNSAGQVVYVQTTQLIFGKNTFSLDLSHLPAGYYSVRLQTEKGGQSMPFNLQR